MKYKIKKIRIPFKQNELILFSAQPLCKIIEVLFVNNSELDVVVLERWGQIPDIDRDYQIVILKENEIFEHTQNYEPVLSRRGKFQGHNGRSYYVFQL